jgi:hypothetical protein
MATQRIPPDQRRSVVIHATLRPTEREQLEQHAASRGLTVSNIVRRLILRDLRRKAVHVAQSAT